MTKKCSSCLHSAMKLKYRNTVPSIHTCMNEKVESYLKDDAWSYCCDLWEEAPEDWFSKPEKGIKLNAS